MTQSNKNYGNALYDLAAEEQLCGVILQDLDLVRKIFLENPDYLKLLSTPSIPKEERCALLDEAFRADVHLYTLNFLKILCENGILAEFPGCMAQYRCRYNADNGIMEVTAVTAVPLREELRARLQEKLEKVTGRKISLALRVDDSVLGGVRLELPEQQLDGTVQSHLQQLQRLLHDTVL